MTDPKNQYRDEATGQYSYFGNFDRLCTCGHTLGIHCAGGFDCFATPIGVGPKDFQVDGLKEQCGCQKFRQSRKKSP